MGIPYTQFQTHPTHTAKLSGRTKKRRSNEKSSEALFPTLHTLKKRCLPIYIFLCFFFFRKSIPEPVQYSCDEEAGGPLAGKGGMLRQGVHLARMLGLSEICTLVTNYSPTI